MSSLRFALVERRGGGEPVAYLTDKGVLTLDIEVFRMFSFRVQKQNYP